MHIVAYLHLLLYLIYSYFVNSPFASNPDRVIEISIKARIIRVVKTINMKIEREILTLTNS